MTRDVVVKGEAVIPAGSPAQVKLVKSPAGGVVGAVTGAGVLEGAIVGAGGGLAWGLLDEQGREVPDETPLRFSLEKKLDL